MSGVTSGNANCEEDVLRIKKKLEKMMKTNDIDAGLDSYPCCLVCQG